MMNYTIHIGEKTFEVELEDINKRPIVARINGKEFLVTPENPQNQATQTGTHSAIQAQTPATQPSFHDGTITSPLPGTIVEIFVKPGDAIEAGQVIVIIEAMKMKNSIRSTKSGTVATIFVKPGENVAHKQKLLEFLE